jgi:integrase
MLSISFDPPVLFNHLKSNGYSLYTIKQYFVIAAGIEPSFKSFLKSNSFAFKNCYKDKTDQLDEQSLKALNSVEDSQLFNAFCLMTEAGLRISEVQEARWENFKDGFLTVVGKGNRERKIPFQKEFLREPKVSGLICGDINPFSLRTHLSSLAPGLTPHSLRAHFITKLAQNGALSIKDVALLAGHSSIQTTSRYIRTDLNRIKEVMTNARNG